MRKHLAIIIVLAFHLSDISLLFCYGQLLSVIDGHVSRESRLQTYIVHVLQPKGAKFLRDIDREKWHQSFLPNTTLDSGEPRLLYSYRDVISGFAARLTPDEAKAMESRDGFLHAQPDERLAQMTTYTPRYLGLSQWDGLWPDSFLGEGVIIGVVDIGITPTHPSFHDDGSMPPPPPKWKGRCDFRNSKSVCNNKLIGATGFYNGKWTSPLDGAGHGTHVAGIAAGGFVNGADVLGQAKGTASGMAPKAHLASYKALDIASDILAAVDEAIHDGVDVISISKGNPNNSLPLYNDTMAIASLAAVRKGISACLGIGNSGPYKSFVSNTAPWILTVGASSTDRRMRVIVRLGDGTELEGESAYQPSNFNSNMTHWPLEFPGFKGRPGRMSCNNGSFDDNGIDIKGKIVMCLYGDIESVDKGKTVKSAGGAAMILLNSFTEGSTTFADIHALPVAHVNHTGASKIVDYLKSTPNANATIISKGTQFGARPSPGVAFFSSRGPSLVNGGILKPDILGPGVNILSAWPFKVGNKKFNFQSGTSMATPHLAGIVALLKSTHPEWSPAAIKSAIMTTADRFDLDGNPIVDEYEGIGKAAKLSAMGAGQVNPLAANDPGLIYDIRPYQYIHYLCGLGYTDKEVTIIFKREIECSNFPNISVEQLNYPSISVSLGSNSKKTITRQVTNVGEADEIYLIQVEEPNGVRVDVSPSKLQFSRVDQNKRFHVEFSVKRTTPREGEVSEGQLLLISNKHLVRSPILITFT